MRDRLAPDESRHSELAATCFESQELRATDDTARTPAVVAGLPLHKEELGRPVEKWA
jgi:hypothetical protein